MMQKQWTKRKKLIACLILYVVMIISCSSPKPLPANTPAHSTATEVLPTLTLSPTLVSNATPSPELLHTPITEHCLKVLDSFTDDLNADGFPVLWGKALNPYAYLYNFETRKSEKIPAHNVELYGSPSVAISPDQTKIAYFDRNTDALIVKNAALQNLSKIQLKRQEDSYVTWLGNQNLMIVRSLWSEATPQPAVILDAFTGEQTVISSDYPELFSEPYSTPRLRTIYNPQLTRVVYPIRDNNIDSLALWDVQNEDLIAEYSDIRNFGEDPQWSPDGSQIVFVNDTHYIKGRTSFEYDLYSIDFDGKLKQLTALRRSNKSASFYITEFSWSPNGRYIAFWFTNSTGYLYQDFQLGVLDLQTKEVTNYCGLDVTDTNKREIAYQLKPVWSPDSTQLLVMTRLGKDELAYNELMSGIDKNVKVFLVDLPTKSTAPMIDNLYPVGWLK